MTIALGFECSDGVVLSADTEMCIPGWVKFPGSKIRMYNKIDVRPMFTFAGDVSFCETFMTAIVRRILPIQKSDWGSVLKDIEEEVLAIHRKFSGELYERDSAVLMSLWLGPEKQKKRLLFEISGGLINRARTSCLGSGQPAIQGMITEMFKQEMTTEQAALLCVFLLAEAEKYGYGCGKDSQIVILHHHGGWQVYPGDPYSPSIEDLEMEYSHLKRLLRPVILDYCNLGIKPPKFAETLEAFTTAVITRRKSWNKRESDRIDEDIARQVEEWEAAQQEQDEDEPSQ